MALFLFATIWGCRKAGLIDSAGSVQILGAYRVTEENTDYVFFELHESEESMEHMSWYYAFDSGDGNFGTNTKWQPLDFSTGVHLHELRKCGDGARCGSFSWQSDATRKRVSIRMLYHPEGVAELTSSASLRTLDTSPSAMVYGVFDSDNAQVQIRVEDNFGVPSRSQTAMYGMTRRFHLHAPSLSTVPSATMKALRSKRRDNFLFPADFCSPTTSEDGAIDLLGYRGWLQQRFDPNASGNGVCVSVDFQDKTGRNLTTHTAFARRNPKFLAGSYNYANPLRAAIKVPVVISYCSDAIGADSIRDPDFFDYQREVIGFGQIAEDTCIRIGSESAFRTAIASILSAKLAAAKASSSSNSDFIFTIVLHQNLSTEFRTFHQILAEELNSILVANDAMVSPRLAGAFVYDSRSDFRPSSVQEQRIVWCPHNRPQDPSKPITTSAANCIVTDTTKLDLTFINFVTPMGPFPTLSSYRDYVNTYGDRGIARKPDLGFLTVPQTSSTFSEANNRSRVTYFDNERLKVEADDHVRVCWERSGASLLGSLRFREQNQASTTPGIDILNASANWDAGGGVGDFRIGVLWENPFVGEITYKSPLTGNVLMIVPFSRDFDGYQVLGDSKWLKGNLDIGNLLQVCTDYCDHPYFDEAGTYQTSVNYSDSGLLGCVAPSYPKFGGS